MNKFPHSIITKEFLLPTSAKEALKMSFMLIFAILIAFDFFTGYMGNINADSVSGLSAMLGPISLIVIPLLVICWKPLEFILAVFLFLGGGMGAYQWTRQFKVVCPKCKTEYKLAYSQTYQFACPNCYHVIDGELNATQTQLDCTYCGLAYTGSASKINKCPSCQNDPNNHELVTCSVCSAQIPKGVIFCNSCNTWLGIDTKEKSISLFSQKICLSYVISQVKELKKGIAESSLVLKNIKNLMVRMHNCMLGIQMIYVREEKVPLDILKEFHEILWELQKISSVTSNDKNNWVVLDQGKKTISAMIAMEPISEPSM